MGASAFQSEKVTSPEAVKCLACSRQSEESSVVVLSE